MTVKPLFIPLKRKYFEAFERGEKDTEYRPYGPRWRRDTCWVGRPVTLSLGYGKAGRLTGRIVELDLITEPQDKCPGWTECYGPNDKRDALAITIALDKKGE